MTFKGHGILKTNEENDPHRPVVTTCKVSGCHENMKIGQVNLFFREKTWVTAMLMEFWMCLLGPWMSSSWTLAFIYVSNGPV